MTKSGIVQNLEALFNPRSVAIIGATNNRNKWGFSTFSSILDGFGGKIYPVNNIVDEVLGHKTFRRVMDIPEPVDLAVFVIPALNVPLVMEDCVAKGVKAAIIISAGFVETGEEGKRLQDEVVRIAQKGKIRFVGPNCMGLWSASSNLRAFMSPMLVREGPLAFVSQGGNIGGAVVTSAYQRGVGFRQYVSCGAAADIQIEDYIEYFGEDPEVKVILAYIEGLNDGRRFIEKVRRVTSRKPVIALKPGKTDAAVKAIRSHSGALSGSNVVYNTAFQKAGVLRVETEEELLDVALGFLTQPLPEGRNVAIITPGGSYGVICADACANEGLNVIKLPEETISALDKMFPPRWSHGNPVDPAGDRNFIAYLTAPEKLLKLNEVDSLIFMGFGGFSGFSGFTQIISSLFGANFTSSTAGFPKEFADYLSLLGTLLGSRDESTIANVAPPIITALGSFFGVEDREQLDDFARTLTSAIVSGDINTAFLSGTPQQGLAPGITGTNGSRLQTTMLTELVDAILGGLVRFWVRSYGKPLITTSFTEGISQLRGRHFAYSSAHRAARVLAKLVEYKEHLEAEGIYKP
jgi:succinyl-CoA synthetase alpha subunit